jgi:hypothetical protein
MNSKLIVGALIAAIAYFLLGWLIWGMLLMNMMEPHMNATCMRPETEFNMGLLIAGNLLWGAAFSFIYSKANLTSFSAGAVFGAILTVLIGLSIDVMMYTFHTIMTSLTPAWINIVPNAVVGGIVGGLLGWWYGRK